MVARASAPDRPRTTCPKTFCAVGPPPGLVTLTDCRPTFCFHTIYPILGRPQHIDDLTFPRTKSTNLTIRKDGSPSRSPCRYAICLLAEFPREGYDQALDLPQAVQVRSPALELGICERETDKDRKSVV